MSGATFLFLLPASPLRWCTTFGPQFHVLPIQLDSTQAAPLIAHWVWRHAWIVCVLGLVRGR